MTKGLIEGVDTNGAAPISAKDVCDIIRSCQKHGVSSFKFNGLALEFGEQSKKLAAVVNTIAADNTEYSDSEPDLDQMMVEDPVAYEKYHRDRHDGD